jgi:hypothetical protein
MLCSSYLPLGVPNWTVKNYQHRAASLHYPDRFCRGSPRGGVMWGGDSNNRATRHMMAVIAAIMNSNDHTANRCLM